MGELDDVAKKAGKEHVADNVQQLLGTLNEAISRFDVAEVTKDEVIIPISQRSLELKMIREGGEWELEMRADIHVASKNGSH